MTTSSPNSPSKLVFALSTDEAGPFPVSSESLWCAPEAGFYRIKNIPFFLEGISFDDLVAVRSVGTGLYRIASIKERSRNSTLWINIEDEEGRAAITALQAMGCGVEGGVLPNYFAVNVPEKINIKDVDAVLEPFMENKHILVDYPSLRHS